MSRKTISNKFYDYSNKTKKLQHGNGILSYEVGDVCALRIPYGGNDSINSRSKTKSISGSEYESDLKFLNREGDDYQLVSFYIKHTKRKGFFKSSRNLKDWMHIFTIQLKMVKKIEFIKPESEPEPDPESEPESEPDPKGIISEGYNFCNDFCNRYDCNSGEPISKCFHDLSKEFHPDKKLYKDGKKMQEINHMYDKCKDQSDDLKLKMPCNHKIGGSRSKSESYRKEKPFKTNQVKELHKANLISIKRLPAVALFMEQSKEYKSELESPNTYVTFKKITNIIKSDQKITKSKNKIKNYLQKLIGRKKILLCRYKAIEYTVFYDKTKSELFELKEDKETKEKFIESIIDSALQKFNEVYLKQIDFNIAPKFNYV